MTVAQMPQHNHGVKLIAEGNVGTTANPTDAMLSVSINGDKVYGPDTTAAEVPMNARAIHQSNMGGGQSQNNMQPYQALMYCVVTQGIFPSRS
ncbi:phage tail protein [Parasphingorhabdus halotolerans]|uniref:Microcystin-dependent protein n=1 Tax=Parasphingorhabdus halotolerans TaxID=2725558 RepID=A0A6H2DJ26_9SPHN|nr:hypothetical protein [Parasphingorhabdus halotolerans]QJB68390.1 hypothetical protein HF685_02945 [Parasphingorhabdus halotolerans]